MINRRTFIAAAGAASAAVALPEMATPQVVRIKDQYAPGQLLILPKSYYLYWVEAPGQARRYGVSVGRAGLEFTGAAVIGAKKEWPTWRPTDEMIERALPDPRHQRCEQHRPVGIERLHPDEER